MSPQEEHKHPHPEHHFEELLDIAGDALIGAVDSTGRALQYAAAHVADVTGDVVDETSTFIDDITEETPLKEWGDQVGIHGRERAEEIEHHADELEDDDNPTCI